MRRFLLLLAPLALGCSDGSGPSSIEFSDVNGDWVFTLTRAPGQDCFGVQGDLVATIDFSGNEDVGNTVSTWSNDASDPDRYTLIGNIQTESGLTELRFWQTVLVRGFLVEGEMDSEGTFAGTAVDPIPGYDGYLSVGGCQFDVVGSRE